MENRHDFHTTVLRSGGDWLNMHYIQVPVAVVQDLVGKGVKRVLGELNGVPFRLALISDGEGGRRIMVGTPLRKAAKTFEGGQVVVSMWPDPDPDRIDLPEEFQIVLEQDEEAAEKFYAMTPGRQRSLAYYAASAKQVDTRIKRAIELAHKLKTNEFYSDKRKLQ